MNSDCIFDILQYLNLKNIVNCLLTCKNINNLNTLYLYKLLGERDFGKDIEKIVDKNWNEKYILCKKLNVLNNKLNIGKELYKLYTSEILDLRVKHLTFIPKEISILNNLKKLTLSHNYIKHIPKEIRLLTNLTELNLYNNKLTFICNEIRLLTNLKILVLSGKDEILLPTEINQNNVLIIIPDKISARAIIKKLD